MAKSPNSIPFNSYSVSFTQQYGNWQFPSIYSNEQPERTTQEEQEITVSNELAWMDYVESEFIQDMLTYPDAEAIINKITKEIKDD